MICHILPLNTFILSSILLATIIIASERAKMFSLLLYVLLFIEYSIQYWIECFLYIQSHISGGLNSEKLTSNL